MDKPIAAVLLAGSVVSVPACTIAVSSGSQATLTPSSENVLSASLTFTLPGATMARVVSTSATEVLTSPYVYLDDSGYGQLEVLGLAPSTMYSHLVEPAPNDIADAADPITAQTGPLPEELSTVHLTMALGTGAPEAGYFLVSGAGNDVFALDAAGTVRWYRAFDQPVEEAKMQGDGTFTVYEGASNGWQPVAGNYVRLNADGSINATNSASSPDDGRPDAPAVYTDPHELLITADAAGAEHVNFFGYEQQLLADRATLGTWHQILRQTADGKVEFRWNASSYFNESDTTETIADGVFDMDHANALAIDPSDGNYIASFRDTDALLKVDANSGAVLWQLSGARNQFSILDDPLAGFQGQHSVRVLDDGHLLLYDNGLGHSPQESRAVEYEIDPDAHTARSVWQYRHTPPIFTPFLGSVERLANGNTLVAFGEAGVVDEVDPEGSLVWEGQLSSAGEPMVAYRIRRLPSLYLYLQP